MGYIDKIFERARADKQTIVLPEPMDRRTYEAAVKIVGLDIANIAIIGTPEEIAEYGKDFDLTDITIVDPLNDPNKQKYIDKFVELRAKKGVTPEQAKEMASLSDGAIVGSAIVKLLEQYGTQAPPRVGEYVKSMKDALREGGAPLRMENILSGRFERSAAYRSMHRYLQEEIHCRMPCSPRTT